MEKYSAQWFQEEAKKEQYQAAYSEAKGQREQFLSLYGPDKLRALTDENILETMFYSEDSNQPNMCKALRYETNSFVSLQGGSNNLFLLYYDQGTKEKKVPGKGWTCGGSRKERKISREAAVVKAKEIRDALISIYEYIDSHRESVDYSQLCDMFCAADFNAKGRFLKYFAIAFPDVIPLVLTDAYRKIALDRIKKSGLQIPKSQKEKRAFLELQIIAEYTKQTGIDPILFEIILFSDEETSAIAKDTQNRRPVNSFHFAANPDAFNHEGCFKKYGFIDWREPSKLKKNDIVYIYVSGESCIKYKCCAIETGRATAIGDGFWQKDPKKKGPFCRLQLLSKLKSSSLTLERLEDEFGYRYPQGHEELKNEKALAEIERVFAEEGVAPEPPEVSPEELRRMETAAAPMTQSDAQTPALADPSEPEKFTSAVQAVETENMEPYSFADAKGKGFNKVYYGTPGCGKSSLVKQYLEEEFRSEHIFRTVFHSEYANSDFIGQIMPVKEGDDIGYSFMPGPFTVALEDALCHPDEKVALVIEELNRGNAAGIFGELFQLLDRCFREDDAYPIGTSEYGIVNIPLLNYLHGNIRYKEAWRLNYQLEELRLPANLYIFSTMNTSDQNVFTLDTAFKRRWIFEKVSNLFEKELHAGYYVPGVSVTWQKFVETVNGYMVKNESVGSEDRQIGKWFVNESLLLKPGEEGGEKKKRAFAYKVLEYLWSDVAKFNPTKWFVKEVKTFDEVVDKFVTEGLAVFSAELKNEMSAELQSTEDDKE